MKCQVKATEDSYSYLVTEFTKKQANILEHFFYTRKGDTFEKIYPIQLNMFPQEAQQLNQNLKEFLPLMVGNFLDSPSMEWEKALEAVVVRLEEHQIRWWLTGSAACSARGINIQPHDLDIMTYLSEIEKFKGAFMTETVEPFQFVHDWIVKGFGVVYLDGRVDFAFEPEPSSDDYGISDSGVYASEHLESITWCGYTILVPPVELHLPANISRERTRRVELIENYINLRG